MQPIRLAIEGVDTYVFDISPTGYATANLCPNRGLDLSDKRNITVSGDISKSMLLIGTNRRFINRYAKKLLNTDYDIEYGKSTASIRSTTVVYAYTEGHTYWSQYGKNEKLTLNPELMEIAFRLVEISPIEIRNLYTPNTLPKEFKKYKAE